MLQFIASCCSEEWELTEEMKFRMAIVNGLMERKTVLERSRNVAYAYSQQGKTVKLRVKPVTTALVYDNMTHAGKIKFSCGL